MKTIKYLAKRAAIAAIMVVAFVLPAKSQISQDTYFNIDWQFNIPLGNDFSSTASGWGMNFEGGYYVTPQMALGAFINYHTNNEYIPRRTLHIGNTALNTDQQHSLFQLPFGMTARYRFDYGMFQPYVGMKLGAEYAKMSSDFYIFENSKNTWGFFASPEVGFMCYPWPGSVGFHAAIYYSIATNQGKLMGYDMNTINSLGFRLGLAF